MYALLIPLAFAILICAAEDVKYKTQVCTVGEDAYKPKHLFYVNGGTYESLYEGKYVIDKTNFIERILELSELTQVVTAPRRFGKTTNLQMLQHFLSIQFTEEGDRIEREDTAAFQLFNNSLIVVKGVQQKISPDLLISKKPVTLKKYQGKFPVIYIDFVHLKNPPDTYELFIKRFGQTIQKAFDEHNRVLTKVLGKKSKKYGEEGETILQRMLQQDIDLISAATSTNHPLSTDESFLHSSISQLCEIYHRHLGLKPVVLIDEYDSFPNSMIFTYNLTYRNWALGFFENFLLATFKDAGSHVTKGVLTGIVKIGQGDIFPGFDTAGFHGVYNGMVGASFYGITQNEWSELCKREKISPALQEKARLKYDGYNVMSGESLYNTTSIIQFINTKEIKSFWMGTSSIDGLFTEVCKKADFVYYFSGLATGGNTSVNIGDSSVVHIVKSEKSMHVELLVELLPDEVDFMMKGVYSVPGYLRFSTFTKILLSVGYLTPSEPLPQCADFIKGVKLKCPNKEILHFLSSKVANSIRINYQQKEMGNTKLAIDAFTSLHAFMFSDEKKSEIVNADLTLYYSSFTLFINRQTVSIGPSSEIVGNEAVVHSLLLCLLLEAQTIPYLASEHAFSFHILKFDEFQMVVGKTKNPKKLRPDIVVVFKSHAVLIEMKYDCKEKLDVSFHQVKEYTSYFYVNNLESVKSLKYVMINVFENKTCNILGEFISEKKYESMFQELKKIGRPTSRSLNYSNFF